MILQEANDEFSIRYYKWAVDQARLERDSAFALLRSLPSSVALRAVRVLDSLEKEQKWETLRVMLKKFHPRACELIGDPMTASEEEFFRRLISARRSPVPEEEAAEKSPARKRLLVSSSRIYLEDALGCPHQKLLASTDRYVNKLGSWSVETVIDFGRSPYYLHNIVTASGERLGAFISILSWLGIAGQTSFDIVVKGEEEAASRLWSTLCKKFVQDASKLLEGVSVE